MGRFEHEGRRCSPGVEAPTGDTEDVLTSTCTGGFHRLREQSPHGARAYGRGLRAKYVSVERVGKAHLQPATGGVADEEAAALEVLEQWWIGKLLQLPTSDRLTEGQQLQDGPLLWREVVQPRLDQLHEPIGRAQRPDLLPQAAFVADAPVLESSDHELADDH